MATVTNVRTDGGGFTRGNDTSSTNGTDQQFATLMNAANSAATNDNTTSAAGPAGTGAVSGFLAQLQSADGGQNAAQSTAATDGNAAEQAASPGSDPSNPQAATAATDGTVDEAIISAENSGSDALLMAMDAPNVPDDEPDQTAPTSDKTDDTNSTDEDAQAQAMALAMAMTLIPTGQPTAPQTSTAAAQDTDSQLVVNATQTTALPTNATMTAKPSSGAKTNPFDDATTDATTSLTDTAQTPTTNGTADAKTSSSDGPGFDRSALLRSPGQNTSRRGNDENASASGFDASFAASNPASTSTADATGTAGALSSYSLSTISAPAGANTRVATKITVTADDGTNAATSPLSMLGLTIAAKSTAGQKDFTIQITPPELGRVEVKLSVDADGNGQATLIVDKQHTLTLLQQDASTLASTLQDAGINLAGGGLNFSLRGQDKQDGETNASDKNALRVSAAIDDGGIDGTSVPIGRLANGYDYGFGVVRLDIRV